MRVKYTKVFTINFIALSKNIPESELNEIKKVISALTKKPGKA